MNTDDRDTRQGLVFALSAYFLWGFLPLYMKALDHVSPAEVVAHRIIWSVPVAAALLIALGRTSDILAALRSPRMLAMGCVTAGLVSVNWGIYVWAIADGRALDASLGYYINPLFSVALGAIFLGERPAGSQWLAIALAGGAVAILTVSADAVPWAAIGLTVTWAFYALAKKQLPIGPNQGFLLEVLILLVPALGYVFWLGPSGVFLAGDVTTSWLLFGCGFVTAIPLILYANGAKGLRLTTIAIMQYIAPTMIFLCAVVVFNEPFGLARMIAFPMIWAALIIYSVPIFRDMRRGESASR